jgi:uncharacterized protein YuzE
VKITYDPGADALYIQLTDVPVARSQSNESGFNLDYDAAGNVRGIEILYAGDKGINPYAVLHEILKQPASQS